LPEEEYVMSIAVATVEREGSSDGWARLAPWTAIAFVVVFVAGIVVSSPPDDSASNARWTANYSTHGKQLGHLATGVFLILAAILLMSFLTHLWTRIAMARQPRILSPLPIVAAGVAAACIAVGGALMGVAAGDTLLSSSPLPDADILRLGNDLGFVMVGIPGMLATALSIAFLSVQAHAAGIFGARMRTFGLIVAVLLLASLEFFPIAALLVWLIVAAIVLLRAPAIVQHGR
jgi:hypothetical protein